MLGGVAELAEGREVAHGFAPASDPIGGQPGQLPHVGDGRRFVGHGLDGSQRILEAAPVEGAERGLGPLDQALAVGGGGHVGRLADLGGHVGRQGAPARQCGQCGTGTAGVPAAVRAVAQWRLGWRPRLLRPLLGMGAVSSHSLPAPSARTQRSWLFGGRRGVLAALALVDGVRVALPTLGVTLGGHLAGAAPGHVPPLLGAPGQRGGGVLVAARPFRGVPGARPGCGVVPSPTHDPGHDRDRQHPLGVRPNEDPVRRCERRADVPGWCRSPTSMRPVVLPFELLEVRPSLLVADPVRGRPAVAPRAPALLLAGRPESSRRGPERPLPPAADAAGRPVRVPALRLEDPVRLEPPPAPLAPPPERPVPRAPPPAPAPAPAAPVR